MSTVVSPVTSGFVRNSQAETTYSAYDGSSVALSRTGPNHGKSMSVNYKNVNFIKVSEKTSKIDTWRKFKPMPFM